MTMRNFIEMWVVIVICLMVGAYVASTSIPPEKVYYPQKIYLGCFVAKNEFEIDANTLYIFYEKGGKNYICKEL